MITREWLDSWDIILINSSAGKDSQTMLRHVVNLCQSHGMDATDLENKLVVVHADLGEIEWPGCPELAEKQAQHYGLRFEVTRRNGCDLLEYARRRGKWPSSQQRWCTSDFKRGPIRRVMTYLVDELYVGMRQIRILNCMGMRGQESPTRAKKPILEMDGRQVLDSNGKLVWRGASNGKREVWNWLPIHGMTIDEVWADIHASGVPYHPAYDLGMPRLSCCFCIFAPPAALRLAGKHRPELLERYVQVERETGHKFRVDVSLEDIQRQVLSNVGPEEVTDWRM